MAITALIPGGYASSSLVSHIMYEKYADALPLYRQEKGFELLGVSISRMTMAGWIITGFRNYLKPVYDYFHCELLKRHFLMADETPIQVIKESGRTHTTICSTCSTAALAKILPMQSSRISNRGVKKPG